MKQKKRIWWTFNLWEADAFQQYLEEMALQGWFLENVGGSVMKFYRAQPAKKKIRGASGSGKLFPYRRGQLEGRTVSQGVPGSRMGFSMQRNLLADILYHR